MRPSAGAQGCAAIVAMVAAIVIAAGCSRARATPPAAATRIVSLGPSTTETLFAIGAGPHTVGRSRYCDWPPEATKLPAVGGIEPDVEAIVALSPDLVVGPSGGWSARLSGTLSARRIATWFPDEIRSLADVDALVTTLGAKTGEAEGARHVVDDLHEREAEIDRAVEGLPRPRVLFVVQSAPIVAAGPGAFAEDVLKHAGATNAVTDGGAWPVVSFERVVEMDPDVVVDATVAPHAATHITPGASGWSEVRAVREGHVVVLPDERALRPGPRIAEGIAALAHALHPDVNP